MGLAWPGRIVVVFAAGLPFHYAYLRRCAHTYCISHSIPIKQGVYFHGAREEGEELQLSKVNVASGRCLLCGVEQQWR